MKKTYSELTYIITKSHHYSVVSPGTVLHTNEEIEEFDTEDEWKAKLKELGLTPPQSPEPPSKPQRTPEARQARQAARAQRKEQEMAQRKATASMSPLENKITKLKALPRSNKVDKELQKATQKLQVKAAKASKTKASSPTPAPKAPAKRSKKKSV